MTSVFSRIFAKILDYQEKRALAHGTIKRNHVKVVQKVLVIDHLIPDPARDAGSYAATQEMKLMQSLGCEITFLPERFDDQDHEPGNQALRDLGVKLAPPPAYRGDTLQFLVDNLQEMDAVYITRFGVVENILPTIREISRDVPILFNNADLHFLREMRAMARRPGDSNRLAEVLDIRRRELSVCRSVDAVLCYTNIEHAVLTSHIPRPLNLQITPWVVDCKPQGPNFRAREGLVFLGNFQHSPNTEAVSYFIKNVMPKLALVRSDISLFVYGSNMSDEVKDLGANTDNVRMMGFAENLDEVFHSHRIFIAPLVSGAGLKGKVLQAMGYGIATIVSEIAAEGTGLVDQVSTLTPKTETEWIDNIVELYENEERWETLVRNARTIASDYFSFDQGRDRFKAIFESVGLKTIK